MLYSLLHTIDQLDPGAVLDVLIECPPDDELGDLAPSAHVNVSTGAHCTVQLFRAPQQILSAGTELYPNTDSEGAPPICPVRVFTNADVDDAGQLIASGFSRWEAFRYGYWPLQPATQYLLSITNAADPNTADTTTFVLVGLHIALRTPEQP